jgi:hypothetical protein
VTDQTDDEARPPEFAAFLVQTNKGRTHDELSARFAELVRAVRETGKTGVLQLRIEVKPVKGTDGEQVVITDSITAKTPQLDRPASMFFTTDDGGLSRNDPKQAELFDVHQERNR